MAKLGPKEVGRLAQCHTVELTLKKTEERKTEQRLPIYLPLSSRVQTPILFTDGNIRKGALPLVKISPAGGC